MLEHWKIHSPEPSEHLADAHPRGSTGCHRQAVNYDRGKKNGLLDFDGKADDFAHWRRRLASYISDEDVTYEQLIDWARQQPQIHTGEVENNDAS